MLNLKADSKYCSWSKTNNIFILKIDKHKKWYSSKRWPTSQLYALWNLFKCFLCMDLHIQKFGQIDNKAQPLHWNRKDPSVLYQVTRLLFWNLCKWFEENNTGYDGLMRCSNAYWVWWLMFTLRCQSHISNQSLTRAVNKENIGEIRESGLEKCIGTISNSYYR